MSTLSKYAPAGMRCLGLRLVRFPELVEGRPALGRHLAAVQSRHVRVRLGWLVPSGFSCNSGIARLPYSSLQQRSSFVPQGFGNYATAAIIGGIPDGDVQGSLWKVAHQESVSSEHERQVVNEGEDPDEDGLLAGSLSEEEGLTDIWREKVQEKVVFLKEMGLSDENLAKLVRQSTKKRRPLVLRTSVKKLNEVATFLIEEVGLSKEQAAKALFMSVGSSSVDECLRPKFEYFKQLGFSRDELVKLVCLRPLVLKPSKERIDDIVNFMQGLGTMDAHKIIKSHPQILGLNLEGSMVPTIKFFKHELELDPKQLTQVFKWPNIFSFSVENNLRFKTQYFRSIGMSKEGVAKMIASSPTVFALNMEVSIKPKVDYLLTVLKKDLDELVDFPGYLTYSLSRRIRPRFEYTKEVGCDFYSLSYFLTCSEAIFKKRCKLRAARLARQGRTLKSRDTALV